MQQIGNNNSNSIEKITCAVSLKKIGMCMVDKSGIPTLIQVK